MLGSCNGYSGRRSSSESVAVDDTLLLLLLDESVAVDESQGKMRGKSDLNYNWN